MGDNLKPLTLSPVLKIGMTLVILSWSGKIPRVKDKLNMSAKAEETSRQHCLVTVVAILSYFQNYSTKQ